jgi:hypothetical protein
MPRVGTLANVREGKFETRVPKETQTGGDRMQESLPFEAAGTFVPNPRFADLVSPNELMTLATGTKLSRYEIRSKIGEGGMGEVYRAGDTELGREVAVKVFRTIQCFLRSSRIQRNMRETFSRFPEPALCRSCVSQ